MRFSEVARAIRMFVGPVVERMYLAKYSGKSGLLTLTLSELRNYIKKTLFEKDYNINTESR